MRWFPFSSLHVPAIALHLSDHAIAVLRLDAHKRVVSFGRKELASGVLEEGHVRDAVKLEDAIRELCATLLPKPISLDDEIPVILSIPEARSFTHIFSVPTGVAKEKLPEMVLAKASRLIPMDLSLLYSDWHIVEENVGGTDRVLFAAAPREIVDSYIAVCEACDLLPLAIDMETISLARALLPDEKTTSIIIDIGERTTNLGFFDEQNKLGLSVSIPIAGKDFTRVLTDTMHVDWETAEKLKREQGLDRRIPDNRVMVIVQERLQAILHELHRAMTYFESTYRKPVKRIVFAGGSSLMPDLVTYYAMNMRGDVSLGDPLRTLAPGSGEMLSGIPPVLSAPLIGLALRALTADPAGSGINLLHGWEGERWEERERHILERWKKLALPLFGASLVLLGYVVYAYLYLPYARLHEENISRVMPQTTDLFAPQGGTTTDAQPPEALPDTILSTTTDPVVTASELPMATISETPTGWLNVRGGPGSTNAVITKVLPGESYPILGSEGAWTHLDLGARGEGWVSSVYLQIP